MRNIQYGHLGASLYVPATHKDLPEILDAGCAGARSLIFCTEDAVSPDAVSWAVSRLAKALRNSPAPQTFLRFVRPRNPFVLNQLLSAPGVVDAIDGIVIPKFDSESAAAWLDVLAKHPSGLAVMPTIETAEIFTESGTLRTLQAIDQLTNPVPCLRIGANDLLGRIGLKRQPGQTLYDTPLRGVIERLITLARPAGHELSAPVCDLIGEPETLAREVSQDITWGLWAKTCVHPSQIEVVETMLAQALATQQPQANAIQGRDDAVFKDSGQMLEKTCHHQWAQRVSAIHAACGR